MASRWRPDGQNAGLYVAAMASTAPEGPTRFDHPATRPPRPGRSWSRIGAVVAAVVAVAAGLAVAAGSVDAAGPTEIYADELSPDYQNWSWAEVDLASTAEVHRGSTAIRADLGPWEGLYLARPSSVDLADDGVLEFWLHGGDGPALPIRVVLVDGAHQGATPIEIEPVPGTWTRYRLPVADVGLEDSFGGVWWQNGSDQARPSIHLDDISLTGATLDGTPTDGPSLTVDLEPRTITRRLTDPASGEVIDQVLDFPHPISDGVYGLNFAAPSLLEELAPGVNRWGGNAVERYNHRTGTTNLGKDWFFMNSPGSPDAADRFEQSNAGAGADTLLTLPASGWVADQPAACGYPLPANAPMDASEPHFLDRTLLCGNGQRDGQAVPGRPELTSVPSGPAETRAWVSALVEANGTAAEGGVEHYAVGNEPGLWHITHADVVTEPMTREAIIDASLAHAAAVKDVDPTAAVAGPVLWSGYSYYVTAAEFEAGQRPGDVPTFVTDYLAALAEAEQTEGRRLLDTLAVNYYDDRVFGGGTDELRLASTRSLWDPSYAPDDWWVVRDFVGEGSAVIPRLRSLIDTTYPGTELAITEYNFGGLDTRAGGLAQADALGIFGREGLDQAMLWDPFNDELSPPEASFVNTPAMWAFRMYRNYDGNGSRFGDQALLAQSTDQDVLSVYAARRSDDDAVTVMVINKAAADRTSSVQLDLTGTAEVFNYGQQDLVSIQRLDDVAVDGQVTVTFPGRSVTLLVIQPDNDRPIVSVPSEPTTTTAAPTTTAPATTVPPTTTQAPTTTTPPVDDDDREDAVVAFSEDFADDDSLSRFDVGLYHRDDFVVTETSWFGDHAPAGPNDACTAPE